MGSRERITAPKKGMVVRLFLTTKVTGRLGRIMPGSMNVSRVLMWLATKRQGPSTALMASMPSTSMGQPMRSMRSAVQILA